jgi:hypothetical protein
MQRRSWQRVVANAGGALVLLAVPAMAFAWFTPSAWSALAVTTPLVSADAGQQIRVADTTPAQTSTVEEFSETANTGLTNAQLVKLARAESIALNKAYQSVAQQIRMLSPSTTNYQLKLTLLEQNFALLKSERNSWNLTWRQIGVAHANPAFIQSRLVALQVSYVQANTALVTLQAQEIQSGSTSSYTPPSF